MRVFVTGATGFVGTAVVRELLAAGHEVTGLARSDAAARALETAGVRVHRGALEDADGLRRAAAASEGVIHTAFVHDFDRYVDNCRLDGLAVAALGDGLAGSGHPLVVTSGTAVLAPGRVSTEDDRADAQAPPPRATSERAAFAQVARDVRAMVVRLAPSVHGEGDHGFVPALIAIARRHSASAHVGDGTNRWPAVHRLDAAVLYRLALEGGAAGACYHGIAEEGIAFRDIAGAIAAGAGLPHVAVATADATAHFGWIAAFAARDTPASSARTRADLGWTPRHAGLLEDLGSAGYFD